jgi:hypothetical protein
MLALADESRNSLINDMHNSNKRLVQVSLTGECALGLIVPFIHCFVWGCMSRGGKRASVPMARGFQRALE